MKLLTQNKKMLKSKNSETVLYNWTIPAYKAPDGTITCPNASKCVKGCYATQGAYIWSKVKQSHQSKLDLTRTPEFFDLMVTEIINKIKLLKRQKKERVLIRVHDAGDYYSLDYALTWFRIMNHFKGNRRVHFYAYTKQIELFKDLETIKPKNFTLIYSFGGLQDNLIDVETDRHAAVFQNETELKDLGYIDASQDDTLALTENKKVGLVYHGNKSYENTTWGRVKGFRGPK